MNCKAQELDGFTATGTFTHCGYNDEACLSTLSPNKIYFVDNWECTQATPAALPTQLYQQNFTTSALIIILLALAVGLQIFK